MKKIINEVLSGKPVKALLSEEDGAKPIILLKFADDSGHNELHLIKTSMSPSELEDAVLDAREKMDAEIQKYGEDYEVVMKYLEDNTDIEYVGYDEVEVNI